MHPRYYVAKASVTKVISPRFYNINPVLAVG